MPDPKTPPEKLSPAEIEWLDEPFEIIAEVTYSKLTFFLMLAAAVVAPNTSRTIMETYRGDFQKSHDRENLALHNAIIKARPDYWVGYPSRGPRQGSEASLLSADEYAERQSKSRIGRIMQVIVRGGRRGYAKPNYKGPKRITDGVEPTDS